MNKQSPSVQKELGIAVFDSGLGGLSVMREVIRQMPAENIFYLADTARVPYGGRSSEVIIEYALQAGRFLQNLPIKMLIVACHTVSCHALSFLQEKLSIPVVGMVQAGIEELLLEKVGDSPSLKEGALQCLIVDSSASPPLGWGCARAGVQELCQKRFQRIAVLGTVSTIESGVYQDFFQKHFSEIEVVPIACPLFVPMIEEGFSEHPAMEMIVRHYLTPILTHPVDAVLLGCTHYPLIRPLFEKILTGQVVFVEPACKVVSEVKEFLYKKDLLQQNQKGLCTFYVTDAPDKFRARGSFFLGAGLDVVSKVVL